MLLLIMVSLIQMISESYFIISRLFRHPLFSDRVQTLASLRNLLFIVMATKRLVHLTGIVHEFHKKMQDVEEKLIDCEASADARLRIEETET